MDKKKKCLVVLSWSAVIICASVIFLLSHQPGDDSKELSVSLRDGLFSRIFDALGVSENMLRTAAHWAEYCGLGLLSFNAFRQSKNRLPFFGAFVFCAAYSVTDEIHQIFVPGRAFQFVDIGVDCFGAVVGVFFCFLIYSLISFFRQRMKTSERTGGNDKEE